MIKAYLPAFLWLLVITGLSVMPGVQLPTFTFFSTDKLAHTFVYGVLTWLLLRANTFAKHGQTNAKSEIILLVSAAIYGVLMECVQYAFIPGRYYEYGDMMANALGAIVGWLCFKFILKINIPSPT